MTAEDRSSASRRSWATASVHAVTPDGRKIIYAQISQNTARDLWMVDVEGKEKPQPLVVEPAIRRMR